MDAVCVHSLCVQRKTSFPLRKAASALFGFSFNSKMPSGSDKAAATAASRLKFFMVKGYDIYVSDVNLE